MTRPRLSRVQIRNYKNIAAVSLDLEPLTVLVGPNGAGKSNFVDALAFIADSLNFSVQLALANRGGLAAVCRKSDGRPPNIGLRLQMELPDGGWADYAFDIAARSGGTFSITRERCIITQRFIEPRHEFEIKNGKFVRSVPGIRPRIAPDRLALTVLSAAEEFRPIFDFLTGIRRYSLQPEQLRGLQDPDPGEGMVLSPDGDNAASVLRRIMQQRDSNGYERICNLLNQVVPGTVGVEPKSLGKKETLEFRQDVGRENLRRFDALNMSDGTLRALGILLAVYQPQPPSLIIIEEPESTIHPAATEILMDVLMDGAERSQVLLTTHSPDVLDNKELGDRQIVAVESVRGEAKITPLTETTRQVIRDRLYTPGELLRQGEIQIDAEYAVQAVRNLNLFDSLED